MLICTNLTDLQMRIKSKQMSTTYTQCSVAEIRPMGLEKCNIHFTFKKKLRCSPANTFTNFAVTLLKHSLQIVIRVVDYLLTFMFGFVKNWCICTYLTILYIVSIQHRQLIFFFEILKKVRHLSA